jgi:hypothetical protein
MKTARSTIVSQAWVYVPKILFFVTFLLANTEIYSQEVKEYYATGELKAVGLSRMN